MEFPALLSILEIVDFHAELATSGKLYRSDATKSVHVGSVCAAAEARARFVQLRPLGPEVLVLIVKVHCSLRHLKRFLFCAEIDLASDQGELVSLLVQGYHGKVGTLAAGRGKLYDVERLVASKAIDSRDGNIGRETLSKGDERACYLRHLLWSHVLANAQLVDRNGGKPVLLLVPDDDSACLVFTLRAVENEILPLLLRCKPLLSHLCDQELCFLGLVCFMLLFLFIFIRVVLILGHDVLYICWTQQAGLFVWNLQVF